MSLAGAGARPSPQSQRQSSVTKSSSNDENHKLSDDSTSIQQLFQGSVGHATLKKSVSALTTSKLLNQGLPKRTKINHETSAVSEPSPMDKLLARLSEQRSPGSDQSGSIKTLTDDEHAHLHSLDLQSSCSSLPITPATDNFTATTPATRPASATPDSNAANSEEVHRLKLELAKAKNEISRLDQELYQQRSLGPEITEAALGQGEGAAAKSSILGMHGNKASKATYPQEPAGWQAQDDSPSDTSDTMSTTGGFGRTRGIWSATKPAFQNGFLQPQPPSLPDTAQPAPWTGGRGFTPDTCAAPYGAPTMDGFHGDRFVPDDDIGMRPASSRRSHRYDSRYGSPQPFGAGFGGGYNMNFNRYEPTTTFHGGQPGLMPSSGPGGMHQPYHQQPVGTPLSPHATEFTSGSGATWKPDPVAAEGQTYLPTTEPLNYRRLLDRTVNCNWKYIVDKIVCNNDQQASIFLQQKLKVGTPEQKYEIVEAIVAQAYPLMVNRFGNFLVQRCFEHGTPDQVIKIAEAIRGNTLNLSMDPFGCHVVQKAFDSVPEDYKAIMVGELLRRIPETVIHRYACHVWQKLFELRWTESPPQIMKFVNEALRGMWHEVALGETGSLVVQNIFENCLEDDKRPCIEEVLANIDIVAHGQFGNWCIQHICEHGAPADRSRAVDHVIRYAAEYSMDQFASKVVEKCLKIGGPEFLTKYLDRVCEGRIDRPRIPLIDIASDQYGNYLIQYILTHANPQHRETVAAHIRKHMVSLRGSKFGSRVGMLCTNPAVATRPGPGVGPSMARMPPSARYGSVYR
ncbi:pumilio-family RNA binding repeat protein [Gaeumannomyces tritici R3-111a-1]|uniref:Pumilio-family RNA binding repeat protein n=1 Tax=Gaeumannomyces tritici (strain R3-111a-1) TaxID=644352 RepID=J3PD51_GAET3|nr:pumilio-family RNA binding repeat protein [Gaeumannomyces tritici R3-111a-1]EJT70396.1 pumilio-family RNA binding repeat protein [Gaeumannomyces tritici R3-111a-1]